MYSTPNFHFKCFYGELQNAFFGRSEGFHSRIQFGKHLRIIWFAI